MNSRVIALLAAAVLGLVVLAGAPVAAEALPAAGVRAAAGGTWQKAIEVPGMTALNKDDNAQTTAVSCASAGNCAAGGFYTDVFGGSEPFVVSQVRGRWGKAIEVPGTAGLNHVDMQITSVSCASTGNCAAGGFYIDASRRSQAFVVGQLRGRWGKAIEVPGTAGLNHGDARLTSVSCAPAGSCAGGGFYTDASRRSQAFVVGQVRGRWGKAIEVPGTAGLNHGGAQITSVSCAPAGNCAGGGFYTDASRRTQAFVVGQVRGRWGKAIEVPGTAALNKGGGGEITSVSCRLAGSCAGGGSYTDASLRFQAFVVSQVRGRWGKAIEVPGTSALSKAGYALITSVSCGPAGNCGAGGYYQNASLSFAQAFVVSQVGGRWGKAIEVPGTAALNRGGRAVTAGVSCAPAGNCAGGGFYTDASRRSQAFVVGQVRGRWGKAIEVPGTPSLNHGDAQINSLSCASAGSCGAGGFYTDASHGTEAFVISETT
jgi:hypothetical protein